MDSKAFAMKLVVLKKLLTVFILVSLSFFPFEKTFSQTVDSSALVRKIDFRGKRPQSAVVASLSASRGKVVVLLVRGGSEKLNDEAEGQLKALIQSGYNRIGMVISDNPPDKKSPAISVFSNGQVYAVVEDAQQDAKTGWAIFNLVRDAYEEDVFSKTDKVISKGQNKKD